MSSTGHYVRAVPLSEVTPGKIVGVELEGKKVILTNFDGKIFAVSGICTHEYYELELGFLIEERVVCALHLSQFDLRTGEVFNAPAVEPLQRFNVKVENGAIYVEV